MAGNKTVFQEALRRAHNFAWDRKWGQAISEYRRALAEFDSDPLVWVSLGVALLEAKRPAEAKDAYRRAGDLKPDDLQIQQKLAEIYERIGDVENALLIHLQVATALQKSATPAKAVDAWRAILRLQPAHLDSRQNLADLLEQLQRPAESAQENVALAELLEERGRPGDAMERARRALALDPRNGKARAFIEKRQLQTTDATSAPPAPEGRTAVRPDEQDNPMRQAGQMALSRLADSIFELASRAQGSQRSAGAQLTLAVDYHVRGRIAEAIDAYRRALDNGLSTPDIHFSLGMLCLDVLRLDEAIDEFLQTVKAEEYSLGSRFALALCYRARGEHGKMVEHLLEFVKTVDLTTVQREQAERLASLYAERARDYASRGNSGEAAFFAEALMEFLSVKQWAAKASELRQKIDAIADDGELVSIAELIGTRYADEVLDALESSREYAKQEKFAAATDECYYAIAKAPTFLRLHSQLAEIFIQQGRIEDAIGKYAAIAAVQRVRGEAAQVAATYRQILKYSPDNVEMRQQLIEMLVEQGDIAEAIDQHIAIGEAHARVAQMDRALKAYEAALRLAPRGGKDRWTITILHLIGDIYLQRAVWKDALQVYLQIRKLAPNDDKASLRLIDLYFKLGRDPETENELAHLITLYEQTGETARLIPVVSDMATLRPKNTVLKNYLIELLIKAERVEQAVSELDALGEMQLSAHQTREAIHTIERIIALSPGNVESYRALLAQLQASL